MTVKNISLFIVMSIVAWIVGNSLLVVPRYRHRVKQVARWAAFCLLMIIGTIVFLAFWKFFLLVGCIVWLLLLLHDIIADAVATGIARR